MKDRRGFALILTLIITALLVALLTEFINDVYVDTSSRHNFVAAQQAGILAESGVAGGVRVLLASLSLQSYTTLSDYWAKPMLFEEENGDLQIGIVEENSKLSVNHVTLPTAIDDVYYGMVMRLMTELGLDAVPLCDSLADWIDADDTPHTNGAESAYYESLNPPYLPRNGRLETVEELGLIKGFSGLPLQKLRPFVTVYSEAPTAPAAPVNINTAPLEVLVALHEQMNEDLASRIIEYRADTPFKNTGELSRVPGMESIATSLQTRITTKGNVYRILSQARVGEVTRVIEAVVRIKGAQSTVIYWREY